MKAQNCFNTWVVLHNKYQRNPKQGIIRVLFLLLFILTYNPDLKSQVQYTAPDYHQFIMTNYNNGFVKIGMNQFLAGGSFSIFESNIEGATNTIFPFIFSFACITGNFAYSEPCIGESFIRAEKKGGDCIFRIFCKFMF